MPRRTDISPIFIAGVGPIVIGQAEPSLGAQTITDVLEKLVKALG